MVAIEHEPTHEVRAHPAKSDHAELHGSSVAMAALLWDGALALQGAVTTDEGAGRRVVGELPIGVGGQFLGDLGRE